MMFSKKIALVGNLGCHFSRELYYGFRKILRQHWICILVVTVYCSKKTAPPFHWGRASMAPWVQALRAKAPCNKTLLGQSQDSNPLCDSPKPFSLSLCLVHFPEKLQKPFRQKIKIFFKGVVAKRAETGSFPNGTLGRRLFPGRTWGAGPSTCSCGKAQAL